MSPTIEQLARQTALRISDREEACKRDPMNVCLYPTLEELLVSFLSAVHAGPLKGVGEAKTMWVEHIQDGSFAGGSEDAYHFNADEKDCEFLVIRKRDFDAMQAALALLQSIQQPK
jgi:hypothetical protein